MKTENIEINTGKASLGGMLTVPRKAKGIIIFAHGSGSGRHSPRNIFVADHLAREGFATLLFDLLTAGEEREESLTGNLRFNIPFLSARLLAATDYVLSRPAVKQLSPGYFGASTGAAAALMAAVDRGGIIKAVVSRGGRPDLAGEALPYVKSPTLLIVGGEDTEVIALNRSALKRMNTEKELAIIPGATHLFEEPGALEKAAVLAGEWFHKFIPSASEPAGLNYAGYPPSL